MMKLLSLPAILEHAACEKGRDYMLVEVDHHGASTSRVYAELAMLSEEVVDRILESNMAILTFDNRQDSESLFDEINREFPAHSIIALKVSLFRTFKPVKCFEQLPGCARAFSDQVDLTVTDEDPDGPVLCRDEQNSSTGLYNAKPGCDGHIHAAPGGGVKCSKCSGWFCF